MEKNKDFRCVCFYPEVWYDDEKKHNTEDKHDCEKKEYRCNEEIYECWCRKSKNNFGKNAKLDARYDDDDEECDYNINTQNGNSKSRWNNSKADYDSSSADWNDECDDGREKPDHKNSRRNRRCCLCNLFRICK